MEVTIAGIPAQVDVSRCVYHAPDRYADNPYDYRGSWDLEYQVLDRKGYAAPWLEKKLTHTLRKELEDEIISNEEARAKAENYE